MFLASAEVCEIFIQHMSLYLSPSRVWIFNWLMSQGDQVALLSAFAEMGLKLRLDLPDQAMSVSSLFFRSSTPSDEALVSKPTSFFP